MTGLGTFKLQLMSMEQQLLVLTKDLARGSWMWIMDACIDAGIYLSR